MYIIIVSAMLLVAIVTAGGPNVAEFARIIHILATTYVYPRIAEISRTIIA
jgi:hypothetical protein